MHSKTTQALMLSAQSFRLLKTHKRLFFFPVLGYLCKYIILLWLVIPFLKEKELILMSHHTLSLTLFGIIIIGFMLFLFVINLILFFFNGAVITNLLAMLRHQEKARLLFGLKQACKNYIYVYAWATYAGTLGIFINLLSSKSKRLLKLKKHLHHNHWNMASLFALIQVIDTKCGPITALKKSSELVATTWGEQLKPNFNFTLLLMLSRSLAFLPLLMALFINQPEKSTWIALGSLTLLLLLSTATCYQIINTTLRVVCYCYAKDHIVAPHFHSESLSTLYQKVPAASGWV